MANSHETLEGVSPQTRAGSASPFQGRIGVAQADITPPVGIFARNWGAAAQDVALGVHRPMMATVLTLQEGEDASAPPLILVSLDLGWWRTAEDEWALRGAVLDALGLDEARLLLCLTHTHAGPGICREDMALPGGEMIAPYLDRVRDALIEATRAALGSAEPGLLEWSYGHCALAANRDLREEDKDRFVCGFNPGGAADDTLLVGRVTDGEGKPRATIVNYACHPTTLAWENALISPDYIGAMREVVQDQTGAPCLFLQGASGELAPREQYTGDVAVADRHGRQLGFAVLSTLAAMSPPGTTLVYEGVVESGAPLAVWKSLPTKNETACATLGAVQARFELPLKSMAKAAEIKARMEAETDRVLTERARRLWRVRRSVGDGDASQESIWAWRLGEMLLIAQRNEAYSVFQRELRAAHPGRAVAVLNIANGSVGYLPPAPLYDENIYPVWQTPYERGGAELLVQVAGRAAESLLGEK